MTSNNNNRLSLKQHGKYRIPKIIVKKSGVLENHKESNNASKSKILTEQNSMRVKKIHEESSSYDNARVGDSMMGGKDTQEKMDTAHLKIKLEEITTRILPHKERVSTAKDNFGRVQMVKNPVTLERSKTAQRITEEEYFERERQRIKNFDPDACKEMNEDSDKKQNYMSAIRNPTRTLVQEELKKMIKHSKIISKINMRK